MMLMSSIFLKVNILEIVIYNLVLWTWRYYNLKYKVWIENNYSYKHYDFPYNVIFVFYVKDNDNSHKIKIIS